MKILVFSLIISLLITVCFAEINMNLEFSFPKLNNGLTGLELYDYNGDGNEEIFAIYNGNTLNWELVCYSSIGDTLFTHIFYKENNSERIKKFKILEDTNKLLIVSAFNNNPSDYDLYSKLSIYDFNNFTLITTIDDYICPGVGASNIDVTSFAISDTNDGKIIFVFFDGNGMYANRMKKYLYAEPEISYLEEYNTIYSNFIYDSVNNLFYSAEFHHDYEYWYGPGGYASTEDDLLCNIKNYSNELVSQINTIFEISGFMHSDTYGWFYAIDYPTEFKIISSSFEYLDEPKVVFYRLADGGNEEMTFLGHYICFSSDFSEIIWEQNVVEVSQNWNIDDINLNSTMFLDQVRYFVNFKFNNDIIVRNLENGEIISSDTSSVNPFIALTKSDSTTLFIEQIDDVYFAYSLTFTASNSDDVIHDNVYAYKICNYPNPFNPITTISFSIQETRKIDLSIYNIKGQKIKTLAQNEFTKGSHSIIWYGVDESDKLVSSGIYFYKLNVNGKTKAVKKCLLLK